MVDEPHHVAVRHLCEFAARAGDLDLRFTPSPTAQQGREGHLLVANRRGPHHESEVRLSGDYLGDDGLTLQVAGRADGFDPVRKALEEVKTFRGALEAMPANQRALHWAQLKVYGWLMCASRQLPRIRLELVYLDVVDQTETPVSDSFSAEELKAFFDALAAPYLRWAQHERVHRQQRDAALQALAFPQLPFRAGQRELASGIYRACVQSRALLVQAPTGIGKTIGTLFPALRAMPERSIDKIFFLTAKTPGRQVALEALQKVRAADHRFPLRVIELVAKDKACEHKDKACHGQSCPLANGFFDRLADARRAAAAQGWLDQAALREVALAHGICPYYLGHEMVRWSDVVVGDYNYYFDRSAMLYALTVDADWRVSVLVDEAHNLYARACSMYSASLTHAETRQVRPHVPPGLRPRVDDLLNQWQLAQLAAERAASNDNNDGGGVGVKPWQLLAELPETWLRALQRLNSAISEHLNDHPADAAAHGALLPFYFRTLAFAGLADEFGEHSMCEYALADDGTGFATDLADGDALLGAFTLRNIVPAPFVGPRIKTADSLVLFSATLNPVDYYTNLLGLPDTTLSLDIASPFLADQLVVRIHPVSTRRDDRAASLHSLVDAMARQYLAQTGNYLAFFSSFDYMEMACNALQQRHPGVPVWAQARQMTEAARHAYLQQFDVAGQGIGFAVLGGVFGEGVDLPGKRLIGAFIATLGLPQFDEVNQAISERLQTRFGRGHDYTYVFPGMQKVVQAAGRVIRTEHDTGTILLMDQRYLEARYRQLLPGWWRVEVGG